jgi:hypothetical protein
VTVDAALLAEKVTPPAEEHEPDRRKRRRPFLVGVAVGVAVLAVATSLLIAGLGRHGSSVTTTGVLSGNLPLCYGPSVDINLTPTLVVTAERAGNVVASVRLPATVAQHSYRLSLPPGTYLVRAGAWPASQVVVRAGSTTTADLPGGGCL